MYAVNFLWRSKIPDISIKTSFRSKLRHSTAVPSVTFLEKLFTIRRWQLLENMAISRHFRGNPDDKKLYWGGLCQLNGPWSAFYRLCVTDVFYHLYTLVSLLACPWNDVTWRNKSQTPKTLSGMIYVIPLSFITYIGMALLNILSGLS